MSWHEKIIDQFPLALKQPILVLDPDGIMKDETILNRLKNIGFTVLNYEDAVSFRFLYESLYRKSSGEKLIIKAEEEDFNCFPYDILRVSHKIKLSLGTFFSKLSYPVLKNIDPEVLEKLYEAYQEYDGGVLGDKGTQEFILRNVYGIVASLIKTDIDFIKMLLYIHYKRLFLNEKLVAFIVEELNQREFFSKFQGATLLKYREAFFTFLQEQWKIFLEDIGRGTNRALVAFDHHDIKVYVDTLFLEGILSPVEFHQKTDSVPEWALIGIKQFEKHNKKERLKNLLERINQFLTEKEVNYRGWLNIGQIFGEFLVVYNKLLSKLSEEERTNVEQTYEKIEQKFTLWLMDSYGSLSNLSFIKGPVMVHHVPRYINFWKKKNNYEKVALIVVDGLSIDQWLIIKSHIRDRSNIKMEEMSCFAWIPTMTSISRQAIFAGELPAYFKDSLFTTAKEESLWKRFWENEGMKSFNIKYVKGLGKGNTADLKDVIKNPKVKILGLIIDTIDKIIHGQQLGTAGMHQDIRLWMKNGYFTSLIDELTGAGFHIFVTSDHGNITAVGQGKPNQGVLVETKGERTRIYDNEVFLNQVKEKYDSIKWPGYGLPEGIHIILAESRKAYVTEGETTVSHGGISIEEVIVPFIKIWKEDQP